MSQKIRSYAKTEGGHSKPQIKASPVRQTPNPAAPCLGSKVFYGLVSLLQFRFTLNSFTQLPSSFSFHGIQPCYTMAFWNLDASLCDLILAVPMPAKKQYYQCGHWWPPSSAIRFTCSLALFYHGCNVSLVTWWLQGTGKMSPGSVLQQETPFVFSPSKWNGFVLWDSPRIGILHSRHLSPLWPSYFPLKYYSHSLCACPLLHLNQVWAFLIKLHSYVCKCIQFHRPFLNQLPTFNVSVHYSGLFG